MAFKTALVLFLCFLVGLSSALQEKIAERSAQDEENSWWQNTIVYQIYPRSYQDSDDDGTGDLKGMAKLSTKKYKIETVG